MKKTFFFFFRFGNITLGLFGATGLPFGSYLRFLGQLGLTLGFGLATLTLGFFRVAVGLTFFLAVLDFETNFFRNSNIIFFVKLELIFMILVN